MTATDNGEGLPVTQSTTVASSYVLIDNTALPIVYVDFASGSPTGTGEEIDPVDSLSTALTIVEVAGIIRINEGSTSETISIDQAVTLERNGASGSVIIGGPPPPARSGFISRGRTRSSRD